MIVAGTGHRPDKLGGYSQQAFDKLVSIATYFLQARKPELVISGMALGWDQALAEAAIQQNIPFDAYIPFVGQESMWPRQSQEKYHNLLAKARKVIVCSEGGYSSFKMAVRNRKMVDAADTIVAMYNGDITGGTANCIEYATTKHKRIINLYERFKN
jgi:uncharacterized phage-like protein YoqJ